jgi:hypothetical protein
MLVKTMLDDGWKHSGQNEDRARPRGVNRGRTARGCNVATRFRESFSVPGRCIACGCSVEFHVDCFTCANHEGRRIPNWRERLVCPGCGLINRTRAALHLLHSLVYPTVETRICIAEQVTDLYRWLNGRFQNLAGSECSATGW